MDEIYRRLGQEHEHDLLRDAVRLHHGARVRKERRGVATALHLALGPSGELLRKMLRRVRLPLRPARG